MLITYFKLLSFPLSEATRIQFFNLQGVSQKVAFTKTIKLISHFNGVTILNIYLLPIYLPYLIFMSLFRPMQIFGPGDSRLLNFLNKTLIQIRGG